MWVISAGDWTRRPLSLNPSAATAWGKRPLLWDEGCRRARKHSVAPSLQRGGWRWLSPRSSAEVGCAMGRRGGLCLPCRTAAAASLVVGPLHCAAHGAKQRLGGRRRGEKSTPEENWGTDAGTMGGPVLDAVAGAKSPGVTVLAAWAVPRQYLLSALCAGQYPGVEGL